MSIALALAVAAVALAGLWYGLPMGLRRREETRLRDRVTRDRALVLSYDDGPGEPLTGDLLDLLAEFDARASFFPLGSKADDANSTLDRIAREGHEIGCHSRAHAHDWRSPPWRSTRDALAGFRGLDRWVRNDGLFRPPHGKLNLLTWLWLRSRGARLAWWTLDGGDTWSRWPTPAEVVGRVERDGGAVVLLHDFAGTPERSRFVLETTRALLELARAEHMRVCPLGELLEPQAATRQRA